jgi:type VI secretion system protein VasL
MNKDNVLKTGGDPRQLPDYSALRDELAKLNHPARPDVDWQRVEQLSLSLFRHNGVELQTACWYTLARTHLAAMAGLNEGLAILDVLITRQWGKMWPQPVHARMEILVGFSQRLQKLMRTLALHYADLPLIYQAERHLNALCEALQRLELRHISQLQGLCTFMQNAAARLENTDGSETEEAAVSLPATMAMASTPEPAAASEPLVYTAHEAPSVARVVTATSVPPRGRSWGAFIAGMLTMLVVGGAGLWGWQVIQPTPDIPVPRIASEASLKDLGQLPPLWRQDYGFVLAARANPGEAGKLKAHWQQYINGNALPAETLSGWHQGMAGLQELTRRLNALDERRGKYLTGSELKSMVFMITQNFGRTVPVEEQLRQLSLTGAGTLLPEALLLQTDMHINQLLNRYMLIKQQATATSEGYSNTAVALKP